MMHKVGNWQPNHHAKKRLKSPSCRINQLNGGTRRQYSNRVGYSQEVMSKPNQCETIAQRVDDHHRAIARLRV